MATNLGADSDLDEIEAISGSATGYATRINAFLRKMFGSTTTPFGSLSKLDSLPATPPGSISAFAGATAPTGWLACDGASVSRTTYADLFAAIGTTWGSQSGTTFNVPDLRRRILLGAGGTVPVGTNGPANTVGSVDGDEAIVLSTAQLPAHAHGLEDAEINFLSAGSRSSAGSGGNGRAMQSTNKDYAEIYDSGDDPSVPSKINSADYSALESFSKPSVVFFPDGEETANAGSGSSVPIMPPVAVVLPIVKT